MTALHHLNPLWISIAVLVLCWFCLEIPAANGWLTAPAKTTIPLKKRRQSLQRECPIFADNEHDPRLRLAPVCEQTTKTRNFANVVSAFAIASSVFFSSPPSIAATTTGVQDYSKYNCPQFYASQSLGIQSVVSAPYQALPTSPSSLGKVCSAARDGTTPNGSEYEDLSAVRGLIYLPSKNMKDIIAKQDQGRAKESSSLIITVRSSEDTSSSVAFLGAKIPLSEIEFFPVSVTLSRASNNFLMADQDWEQSILDASDNLYMTAKICDSRNCGSPILEGRGIARKLLVPNNKFGENEDDFRTIRGAASIRLGDASTPDAIYTW